MNARRAVARAMGGVTQGVEGVAVTVEVDAAAGVRRFDVVGLPGRPVREAVDRLQSALSHALPGMVSFDRRWVVNLAPADLDKASSGLDLAMAMAVLARGAGRPPSLEGWGFAAELGLDGSLRPVRGVLPVALALRDAGVERLMVAPENGPEAALVEGLAVHPAQDLTTAWALLGEAGEPLPLTDLPAAALGSADLAVVAGQLLARRALEVAAAGGHHLLLSGPPGAGKTLLARALPGLLPPLSRAAALEVSRIHSVAGRLPAGGVVAGRPFVAPHHSVSGPGLVGGGTRPGPGAASLAHRGVLFLDEVALFPRNVLDTLREPLEEGRVTVTRASGSVTFPTEVQLVAAMNPCPCGHLGDPETPCRCGAAEVARYRVRLSGPLLDRFDLVVPLARVPYRELSSPAAAREASDSVRRRVAAARKAQAARYGGMPWRTNAGLPARALDEWAGVDGEADRLLGLACERYRLSARAVAKTRRVARTVADLEAAPEIVAPHVAEALQYRSRPPVD